MKKLTGRYTSDRLIESYGMFLDNFKSAAVDILTRLGYQVSFTTNTRYKVTTSDRINEQQRQLLEKDRNAFEVYRGLLSKNKAKEYQDERINPGEFLQLVTYDMMHAVRK